MYYSSSPSTHHHHLARTPAINLPPIPCYLSLSLPSSLSLSSLYLNIQTNRTLFSRRMLRDQTEPELQDILHLLTASLLVMIPSVCNLIAKQFSTSYFSPHYHKSLKNITRSLSLSLSPSLLLAVLVETLEHFS